MNTGIGQVVELILRDGLRVARVSCPGNLIPAPGQYLLASVAPDSSLPVPLFYTDSVPAGFIAAAPVPDSWSLQAEINLRGPLGHGFTLPVSARKVALVAFDNSPMRLHGLIQPALYQDAAVVLLCNSTADNLPDDVEVLPLSALSEIIAWADTIMFDTAREHLPELRERLESLNQIPALKEAQALVRTPVPCGGVAECGICAVTVKSSWRMACKDGPVFTLRELVQCPMHWRGI